jgi:UDP-glucose 6-dehydrogenase
LSETTLESAEMIKYSSNTFLAVKFVLLTEWSQAGNLDLVRVNKLMKSPVFFDLRNMYKRAEADAAGF